MNILAADITQQIKYHRLVPVIKLDRVADAVPLAEALISGGLPVAEVTFRTDAAAAAIRQITDHFPDMLVGAGSLTNVEQAKQAVAFGARFLVSAGISRPVTEYAIDSHIPIFPGICTPTELMILLEYNLSVAKFFPAEQYGGLDTVKALSAPFPNMRFMPTGGINPENVMDYLASPKILACGGSWMVKDAFIDNGNFEQIKRLTKEAVDLVRKEQTP